MKLKELKPSIIITFHTTSEAMALEALCGEDSIEGKLISAPRELSSDCGIAWCGSVNTKESLIQLMAKENLEFDKIHEMEY